MRLLAWIGERLRWLTDPELSRPPGVELRDPFGDEEAARARQEADAARRRAAEVAGDVSAFSQRIRERVATLEEIVAMIESAERAERRDQRERERR